MDVCLCPTVPPLPLVPCSTAFSLALRRRTAARCGARTAVAAAPTCWRPPPWGLPCSTRCAARWGHATQSTVSVAGPLQSHRKARGSYKPTARAKHVLPPSSRLSIPMHPPLNPSTSALYPLVLVPGPAPHADHRRRAAAVLPDRPPRRAPLSRASVAAPPRRAAGGPCGADQPALRGGGGGPGQRGAVLQRRARRPAALAAVAAVQVPVTKQLPAVVPA